MLIIIYLDYDNSSDILNLKLNPIIYQSITYVWAQWKITNVKARKPFYCHVKQEGADQELSGIKHG